TVVPVTIVVILLRKATDGPVLTGAQSELLSLAGLHTGGSGPIIVSGFWYSKDQVRVHISSVLVEPRKAAGVVKGLIAEEPMLVWLPQYDEHDGKGEYLMSEKPEYSPWF